MSAYLTFFELEQSPFDGKAQTQVVLGTKALREAFATIQTGLAEGAARICVNGGPGMGKTSLARALPKLLGEEIRVAVALDAGVEWGALRNTIARQWGLEGSRLSRSNLVEASRSRRLVMVIDQAENASEEFLDHLDVLLSYRTETDEPVVQAVLLACLSGGDPASPPALIWWLDRIQTLQLEFAPLPRDGVESYIQKHLKRAGWRGDHLFSDEAAFAIHGYTAGIPGEISKLCEQLLASAAARDMRSIHAEFVHDFCDPPDGSRPGWDLEDEFEELVLEEEFAGADRHASANGVEPGSEESTASGPPPLSQTLEHFQASSPSSADLEPEGHEGGNSSIAADIPEDAYAEPDAQDGMDAGQEEERESGVDAAWVPSSSEAAPFDDPFDGPATPEELRALRGSFVKRHVWAIAATVSAVVLGGLGLAGLGADDEAASNDRLSSMQGTGAGAPSTTTFSDSDTPDVPPVLARVRGPVAIDASAGSQNPRGGQPTTESAPPVDRVDQPVATERSPEKPSRRPSPRRQAVPADWNDPEFLARTEGRLQAMGDTPLMELPAPDAPKPSSGAARENEASDEESLPAAPAPDAELASPEATAETGAPIERFW